MSETVLLALSGKDFDSRRGFRARGLVEQCARGGSIPRESVIEPIIRPIGDVFLALALFTSP